MHFAEINDVFKKLNVIPAYQLGDSNEHDIHTIAAESAVRESSSCASQSWLGIS